MKLLANENFPLKSILYLKSKGFDITSIGADSPSIKDNQVMGIAIREERIILTFDRDYGELIFKHNYKPGKGVIYLRLDEYKADQPGKMIEDLITKNESMKKTALVLSGGGFKGAFQVGALKYLKEHWSQISPDTPDFRFDIVAGVSVGSLNGLLIASNKYEELIDLWEKVAQNGVEEIYVSDFINTTVDHTNPNPELKFSLSWDTIKNRFPETTRNLFLRTIFDRQSILNSFRQEFQNFKSIADNTPLKRKLKQFAKRDEINNCTYMCGYVSLNDGKYYSYKHADFASDSDLMNAVLASTAMPIVWSPIESIKVNTEAEPAKYAVDGGIRNVSPLGDVIREISLNGSTDEYTIIVINCSSREILSEDYAKKNIAQIALRSFVDIAIAEIFDNDIREFISKNYILEQVQASHPGEVIHAYDFENKRKGRPIRYFRAIIIQPDEDMGGTLTANEPLNRRRMEHGYHLAEKCLGRHLSNENDRKFTVV